MGAASCLEDDLDHLNSACFSPSFVIFGGRTPRVVESKFLCEECSETFATVRELNRHRRSAHPALSMFLFGEGRASSDSLHFLHFTDSVRVHCTTERGSGAEVVEVEIQGSGRDRPGEVVRSRVGNTELLTLPKDDDGELYDEYRVTLRHTELQQSITVRVFQPSYSPNEAEALPDLLHLSKDCDPEDLLMEMERIERLGRLSTPQSQRFAAGVEEFAIGVRLIHQGKAEWRERFRDAHWMLQPLRIPVLNQMRAITGLLLLEFSPILQGELWPPLSPLSALVGRNRAASSPPGDWFPRELIPPNLVGFLDDLESGKAVQAAEVPPGGEGLVPRECRMLFQFAQAAPGSDHALRLEQSLQDSPSISVRTAAARIARTHLHAH